ncbi:MAG: hypothetical protein LKF49_07535 [Bifidobacterium tibiigranuli]|jgi:hypothetical protein|uniref:hypothetical protein n=1 Tax=Bifidobacterium tibiigranuli TaxID=2172043 RepID=UPI002357745B|nr:hypothetical protein [Bifidobacterium tibiigranuli]MCH3974055.1 hypothetical protein [Bifidobacterium tibiigranuli]MCH4189085.1 hypothetical protein [Bifidobacterium tibiigranuli]MCH4204045.1 hypothetical protein [Bifidobacterium tibiigranuli]MCH4274448.1 hypothetical protein [Bifidobacterium tibiigranuli]MCI1790777.1 hypothetical protein [Bifidobacterium tibiigranuli]
MSITKKSTGLTAKIGVGVAVAVAAMAFAAPSASASVNYALHAGRDYAQAQTWTNNGNQGRSYAQHGSRSASTGWTTQYSGAYADSGTSNGYHAQVWWR